MKESQLLVAAGRANVMVQEPGDMREMATPCNIFALKDSKQKPNKKGDGLKMHNRSNRCIVSGPKFATYKRIVLKASNATIISLSSKMAQRVVMSAMESIVGPLNVRKVRSK